MVKQYKEHEEEFMSHFGFERYDGDYLSDAVKFGKALEDEEEGEEPSRPRGDVTGELRLNRKAREKY